MTEGSFTFSYIKPHMVTAGGSDMVMGLIRNSGFEVVFSKRTTFTMNQVLDLYPNLIEKFGDGGITTETALANTSGEVDCLLLWHYSEQAPPRLRHLIGITDNLERKGSGIRRIFSISNFQNAIHGSDTRVDALKEFKVSCPGSLDMFLQNNINAGSLFS